MRPDACIFVISSHSLSQKRMRELQAIIVSHSPIPVAVVRLEETDHPLPRALDNMCDAGHRQILSQPLGFPFPESLLAWLPGAAAYWLAGRDNIQLSIGREMSLDAAVVSSAVAWALDNAVEGTAVAEARPSLGKSGWKKPPDFEHHLLVCTGPRCHFRSSASLLHTLKAETVRQGLSQRCLTTRTGCLFPCNKGPLVALYPRGQWYHLPDAQSVERFVSTVLVGGQTLTDHLIHTAKAACPEGRHEG